MSSLSLSPANTLPADADRAALAGRVWRPDVGGPSVVKLQGNAVIDVTATFPTTCRRWREPGLACRSPRQQLGRQPQ
jgi:fumarylacetoacetate (FAA) hydrolase family protein